MIEAVDAAPLVVTALLEPELMARLDELRRRHFPPDRNHLRAHLTLFHALPGEREQEVVGGLQRLAALTAPLAAEVAGVRFLGHGVAVEVASPALVSLHKALQREWHGWLTPQDRQGLRPHVTVQNKVAPDEARALHAQLAGVVRPEPTRVVALAVHRYRGGPWAPVAEVPLTGSPREP